MRWRGARVMVVPEDVQREVARLHVEDGLTVTTIHHRYRGMLGRARIVKIIKERTGKESLRPSTFLPAGGDP